ncbi:MAG: PH domain-containing protein, partial [Saprospiraceae bacterium]|nr:PH domain-containing protein [Saprospiraceae bacterium]
LIYGLMRFAKMMIDKVTTEIAITNKRLVYKRGLVARAVGEMNIDRIEGVKCLPKFFLGGFFFFFAAQYADWAAKHYFLRILSTK